MIRRRGYSLIELVTVLVIAGILAAIFVPEFYPRETDASWFYEQVKAGVRYAQRQAVAQRRTVYVVIDAATVKVCYDAACASPVSDFAKSAAYILTAPSGIVLAPATFSFNGLGQPSAPASIPVGSLAVTVMGETGYVP